MLCWPFGLNFSLWSRPPDKNVLFPLLRHAVFEFEGVLVPLRVLWKVFLDKHWSTLLASVISLIDLEKLSPNNGFECSSCGEEKCLYAIFSSWVMLSFRNVSKSCLSFHNIKAEAAHFFNEAFTSSKSSYGSVNFIPLFKESNKKQIMLWF